MSITFLVCEENKYIILFKKNSWTFENNITRFLTSLLKVQIFDINNSSNKIKKHCNTKVNKLYS